MREREKEEEGEEEEEIYLKDSGAGSNGSKKSCFEDEVSILWKYHSFIEAGEVSDSSVGNLPLCCCSPYLGNKETEA